jgi:hypothetical protein
MLLRFLMVMTILAMLTAQGCKSTSTGSDPNLKKDPKVILKNLGNGTCEDLKTGMIWQIERNKYFTSWEDASEYVTSLELGGFKDWRLPTTDELYDLHVIFELERNGDCNIDRTGSYWAGKTKDESCAGGWETYYQCGPEYEYVKKNKGDVRAVRP